MTPSRRRSLLAFDLDGTLVGDVEALAVLNDALSRLRPDVALAYVTGRNLPSVRALMAVEDLLTPEFIVSDVGTTIHSLSPGGGEWMREPGYEATIASGWSASRVRACAGLFPVLVPQPPDNQGPFKCSYTLDSPDPQRVLGQLTEALRRQRLGVSLMFSSNRDLDILPPRAGKGHALSWLAHRLELELPQVFACGDSGNDRPMLTLACRTAVVANAQPELDTLPIAVYRARAPYAAGVHEALRHYGWL